MGECISTCIDRSSEDWLYGVDIRHDGMSYFITSTIIYDPSQVPAGIFLPTIAIGAALGRAVGLLTYGLISLWDSIGLTTI